MHFQTGNSASGLGVAILTAAEKLNNIGFQSQNRDRIASAILTMEFRRFTIRELLDYFLRTQDQGAWAEFTERTRRTVRGRCASILGRRKTEELLDDLEQDAYLKLVANDYKVLRSFTWTDENAIFRYVRVVAAGAALDWLRRNRSELDPLEDDYPVPAPPNRADQAILWTEILQALKTFAYAKDFERDLAIFKLFYRWGYTAPEIANLPSINLPVKKVENTLQKLVQRVKQKVNRQAKAESREQG
jgi:RNA polymerase sigma factor (sigma-70 family)